jgi:hypothetical protein
VFNVGGSFLLELPSAIQQYCNKKTAHMYLSCFHFVKLNTFVKQVLYWFAQLGGAACVLKANQRSQQAPAMQYHKEFTREWFIEKIMP